MNLLIPQDFTTRKIFVTFCRYLWQPIPGILDYVATKGAIVSFTKALANMLMSTNGIRTNCVNPGPVWTVRADVTCARRRLDCGLAEAKRKAG